MPNHDTFSIPPIGEFVQRYLALSKCSVDLFARNKDWATHTNDLNPATSAKYHMDAEAFADMLSFCGVAADLVLFDPPYSPRQISECYKQIGKEVGMKDTQNAALYARVKRGILSLSVNPEALCFLSVGTVLGWERKMVLSKWRFCFAVMVAHTMIPFAWQKGCFEPPIL